MARRPPPNPRLVGDPVDVVTGANLDAQVDFVVPGAPGVVWRRFYDSREAAIPTPLGRGHRHPFDRRLVVDLDGVVYHDPAAGTVAFPPFDVGGDGSPAHGPHASVEAPGAVLTRVGPGAYEVRSRLATVRLEEFAPGRARPTAIDGPGGAVRLTYASTGPLSDLLVDGHVRLRVRSDVEGRIASVWLRDEAGDRVLATYAYDGAGRLVEARNALGGAFRYAYDADHRVVRREDPRGFAFLFTYDAAGRCVDSRGEDGTQGIALAYAPSGTTTLVTRADGGTWTYAYDEAGALARVTDPYDGERTYAYDDDGTLASAFDENGNPTRYLYGEDGALLAVHDAVGRSPEAVPPLSRQHEPLLQPRSPALFRARRRPVSSVAPPPYQRATPIEWDYGSLIAYGVLCRPAPEAAVLGRFPAAVRQAIQTAPARAASPRTLVGAPPFPAGDAEHDALGNLTRLAARDGGVERWAYDAAGNVQAYQNAAGHTWRYDRASWNLLQRETDPTGAAVAYAHSPTEYVTGVASGPQSVARFAYDLKDRLVRVERAGRPVEAYGYDAARNVTEKRRADGALLFSAEWGPANLLAALHLDSGETLTYGRDDRGRITRAADGHGETAWTYDAAGRCVAELRDGLGITRSPEGPPGLTVFGRFRSRLELTGSGVDVVDPTGARHRVEIHPHGLVERAFANGTRELSQYDGRGRCLLRAAYDGRGELREAQQYGFDRAGRLRAVRDHAGRQTDYAYDAAGRLVGERTADGERRAFAHDPAGNLIRQPGLGGAVVGPGDRLERANGVVFTYDDRGRLVQAGGGAAAWTYEWDGLDRLVGCQTPAGRWTAAYDGLGRRVAVAMDGRTTRFYWDGERLAGRVGPDGAVRVYVYANAAARVPVALVDYDGLDADPASGRSYAVFADHLGAPVRVEDASGAVRWRGRYDPFGRCEVDPASTLRVDLRRPGHLFDPALGLTYNRFRYYSPRLGRYVQPDPAAHEASANVYQYLPDPLSGVDTNGLGCGDGVVRSEGYDADLRAEVQAEITRLRQELDQPVSSTSTRRRGADETVALVVVVKRDGSREIWATSSRGTPSADLGVPDSIGGVPVVHRGIDAGDGPRSHHAEQRALTDARQSDDVSHIETIGVTTSCCNSQGVGCTQAIRDNGDPDLDSVVVPSPRDPPVPTVARETPAVPPSTERRREEVRQLREDNPDATQQELADQWGETHDGATPDRRTMGRWLRDAGIETS